MSDVTRGEPRPDSCSGGSLVDVWRRLPQPLPQLRMVVVLPVRDEAAHLEATLASLAAQVELDGTPLEPHQTEVLLLANNCGDDSAALAHRFSRATPDLALHIVEVELPRARANIGFVRRELMDEACRRLESLGRLDGIVASSDGDTRVEPTWLAAIRREIDAGADAVGGRILTDDEPRPSAAALRVRRLDAAHLLLRSRLASVLDPDPADPWPRHHQHFGASLAVTVKAYRTVGGIPPVEFLEDDALVRALERADFKVRHSPSVRVTTSARLEGRAAVGLSWQLRQWECVGDAARHDPLVEAAEAYATALEARRQLRLLWARMRNGHESDDAVTSSLDALARPLLLDAERLRELLAVPRPFGELWEAIERGRLEALAARGQIVPLSQAITGFRRLVREREKASR